MSAHHFALYAESDTYRVIARLVHIEDTSLRFRLVNVLRVKPGDVITLFDDRQGQVISITEVHKHLVTGTILRTEHHPVLTQRLDLVLPLLEKEALEFAVEHATIHAVNTIWLTVTEKSRDALRPGELDRLMRIAQAAREQSKQFWPIRIIAPGAPLASICTALPQAFRLQAAFDGGPIIDQEKNMRTSPYVIVTIGPEGDYTPHERSELARHQFTPVCLGATILRASHAAALMCGITRALQVTLTP